MEIEQHIRSFTPDGEAEVVYTLRNAQGATVQVSNLGATVLLGGSSASERPLPAPEGGLGPANNLLWESRVETNWVVMSLDLPVADNTEPTHLEAGFYLFDDNTLEITRVENGEQKVEMIKL